MTKLENAGNGRFESELSPIIYPVRPAERTVLQPDFIFLQQECTDQQHVRRHQAQTHINAASMHHISLQHKINEHRIMVGKERHTEPVFEDTVTQRYHPPYIYMINDNRIDCPAETVESC